MGRPGKRLSEELEETLKREMPLRIKTSSLKDLAKEYGVSTATVHRYANLKRVTEQEQKRKRKYTRTPVLMENLPVGEININERPRQTLPFVIFGSPKEIAQILREVNS